MRNVHAQLAPIVCVSPIVDPKGYPISRSHYTGSNMPMVKHKQKKTSKHAPIEEKIFFFFCYFFSLSHAPHRCFVCVLRSFCERHFKNFESGVKYFSVRTIGYIELTMNPHGLPLRNTIDGWAQLFVDCI